MPITLTYGDLVKDLQTLITGRLNDETLCLWQGSHTPGPGDTSFFYLANEATFGGYKRHALVFTAAVLNSDSVATTQSQIVEWQPTSNVNLPQVIGGVFALDASGDLAWADLLPTGSVSLSAPGQVVLYQGFLEQSPC